MNIRVSPLALQGYCPVELARHGRWVPGDVRWTVVYRCRIYRLSGTQQRRQFLADPEKFVPANSGDNPVVSVGQKRSVPGQPAYCAIYHDCVYLFSSRPPRPSSTPIRTATRLSKRRRRRQMTDQGMHGEIHRRGIETQRNFILRVSTPLR